MKKQQVVILGSTGSVGCHTLDVIMLNQHKYEVFGLIANTSVDIMFNQCITFKPRYVVLSNPDSANILQQKLTSNNNKTIVLFGTQDILNIISDSKTDIVMSAMVGSNGLLYTHHAIIHNKKVLLANKESLVAGGEFIINALQNSHATLIPIDSEHSAIFQCLDNKSSSQNWDNISRIILTASGGPFLHTPAEQFPTITINEALKHPNWSMGKKITIDSSTLMNKGLEVIEAYWLFGQNLDKIEVVIHPQSIIHSMVEYCDGSILAQLGTPDMKTPISYGLSYPERMKSGSVKLDFNTLQNLTFMPPDYIKFPCLKFAFDTLKTQGVYPAILNAANEIAVSAFLNKQIKYHDISNTIENTLNKYNPQKCNSVTDIIALDKDVKNFVQMNILPKK